MWDSKSKMPDIQETVRKWEREREREQDRQTDRERVYPMLRKKRRPPTTLLSQPSIPSSGHQPLLFLLYSPLLSPPGLYLPYLATCGVPEWDMKLYPPLLSAPGLYLPHLTTCGVPEWDMGLYQALLSPPPRDRPITSTETQRHGDRQTERERGGRKQA